MKFAKKPNPFAKAAEFKHPSEPKTPTNIERRSALADKVLETNADNPALSVDHNEVAASIEKFTKENPTPSEPAKLFQYQMQLLDIAYVDVTLGRNTLQEIHETLTLNPDLTSIITPQNLQSITRAMQSLTAGTVKKEAKVAKKSATKAAPKPVSKNVEIFKNMLGDIKI